MNNKLTLYFILAGIVIVVVLSFLFFKPTPLDDPILILNEPIQIWDNRDILLDKEIVVEGIVNVGWFCTEIGCLPGDFCNGCSGELFMIASEEIRLNIKPNSEDLKCTARSNGVGDINQIECFLEPNKEYKITGILRKDPNVRSIYEFRKYYIEVKSFEIKP